MAICLIVAATSNGKSARIAPGGGSGTGPYSSTGSGNTAPSYYNPNAGKSVYGKPYVAENGSYYGQPNVNGVPKTVHVSGYYRRDGTYVRGYYRSPPYSNPPSGRSR